MRSIPLANHHHDIGEDVARKIVYQLVDDLDGTELAQGEGETISFAIDGNNYEIDLSRDHARLFRAATEKYVNAARVAGKASKATGRSRGAGAASGPKRDLAAVRSWAAANGHQVSERGRVPNAVLEAYDAAQGK